MADEKNIHWTQDDALIERYVMGRVNVEDSAPLDEHLATCPECRENVRAERQIVAGIRRVGRDELKHRLAQRVGKSSSPAMTNWYRVAGIAAAVVLLVTVGIYNDWFSGGKGQGSLSESKADSSMPQRDQPIPGAGGKQVPGPLPYEAGNKDKGGAPQGVTGESLKDAEREQRKALQIERGNPQNVDVARAAGNEPAKADKLGAFAAQAPEEIWVGGTDVSTESADQSFGKSLMKADEKKYDDLRREKSAARPALQDERGAVNRMDVGVVSVMQKMQSELPKNHREGQIGVIRMKLRKEANGLQVTLFTDSLLSSNDLLNARLQTVRSDSCILHLGKKQIAFRLPPGWIHEIGNTKK